MNIKEIKKEARDILKGNIINLWIPFVINILISIPFVMMIGLIAEKGSYLEFGLSAVCSLLLMPITIGIYEYVLRMVRHQDFTIKSLFSYFNKLGPILVISVIMTFLVGVGSLLIVFGIIFALMYSMSFYIFVDDNTKSSFNCLKQSRVMMKGYKANLFWFILSFIGWIFLGIITFGIAFIYVYPYIITSEAIYYDKLSKIQLTKD